MKLKIMTKTWSLFSDTVSYKINFTAYDLHRDHPSASKLKKSPQPNTI